MTQSILPPVHPGEILKEEYLAPLGMSPGALARRLNVPRTRIERIVKEETSVTNDTALRLAKVFGTSPEFWMNMQTGYDLKIAAAELQHELRAIDALVGAVKASAVTTRARPPKRRPSRPAADRRRRA